MSFQQTQHNNEFDVDPASNEQARDQQSPTIYDLPSDTVPIVATGNRRNLVQLDDAAP